MITLDKKLELIIPCNDNDGEEIIDQNINNMLKSITEIAGGATVSTVDGQWIGENGKVMHDLNNKYEWFADTFILETILYSRQLSVIIHDLMNKYGQEAVSIIVNGTLYIVGDVYELNYIRKVAL